MSNADAKILFEYYTDDIEFRGRRWHYFHDDKEKRDSAWRYTRKSTFLKNLELGHNVTIKLSCADYYHARFLMRAEDLPAAREWWERKKVVQARTRVRKDYQKSKVYRWEDDLLPHIDITTAAFNRIVDDVMVKLNRGDRPRVLVNPRLKVRSLYRWNRIESAPGWGEKLAVRLHELAHWMLRHEYDILSHGPEFVACAGWLYMNYLPNCPSGITLLAELERRGIDYLPDVPWEMVKGG